MSLRLREASFNFLVAVCVGGPPLSLLGVRWPLGGMWRADVVSSDGCGRVFSPSGVCSGWLGLDPQLVSLALVLWCALVRHAVSCRVLPWCVVLVRAVLWCALLCRAMLRRVVPWCAVLCRVAPCPVVVCGVVGCLVVVRCTAVRCSAECRVASFLSWWGPGVAWAVVRLACFVVRDAGRDFVAGWWLGGAVRCGMARWIRAAGVRVCRWGWWVR